MAKELTAGETLSMLREWGNLDDSPEAQEWLSNTVEKMNVWLLRGDGIAVYENQDLGHPEIGDKQFASYGSPAAQLEVETPPERMPDIGGRINWRYTLFGTYKGEPLVVR